MPHCRLIPDSQTRTAHALTDGCRPRTASTRLARPVARDLHLIVEPAQVHEFAASRRDLITGPIGRLVRPAPNEAAPVRRGIGPVAIGQHRPQAATFTVDGPRDHSGYWVSDRRKLGPARRRAARCGSGSVFRPGRSGCGAAMRHSREQPAYVRRDPPMPRRPRRLHATTPGTGYRPRRYRPAGVSATAVRTAARSGVVDQLVDPAQIRALGVGRQIKRTAAAPGREHLLDEYVESQRSELQCPERAGGCAGELH